MMPGPMSDCYVLSPNRSADFALAFLDEFLPSREPTWNAAEPVDILGLSPNHSLKDILKFLEYHTDRSYSMYLRNLERRSPHYAILAYCEDGSLILGLSGDEDEQVAPELLSRLENFTGSTGYWSVEEAPPGDREEFGARIDVQQD
jgi:hypothetical protein